MNIYINMIKQCFPLFICSKEKDMAVAGLTINTVRSTVVDFTYPFWFEPSAAAMHVSLHTSVKVNILCLTRYLSGLSKQCRLKLFFILSDKDNKALLLILSISINYMVGNSCCICDGNFLLLFIGLPCNKYSIK